MKINLAQWYVVWVVGSAILGMIYGWTVFWGGIGILMVLDALLSMPSWLAGETLGTAVKTLPKKLDVDPLERYDDDAIKQAIANIRLEGITVSEDELRTILRDNPEKFLK